MIEVRSWSGKESSNITCQIMLKDCIATIDIGSLAIGVGWRFIFPLIYSIAKIISNAVYYNLFLSLKPGKQYLAQSTTRCRKLYKIRNIKWGYSVTILVLIPVLAGGKDNG